MNTMTSPSSLLAKASGMNSVTGPVLPMPSKKPASSPFPCLGPYHGADSMAASVDQSTSSVTRSRTAWTSPRPNASYICLVVPMFCSALMFCSAALLMLCSLGCRAGSGPERGHGRAVADELVDAAHAAAVEGDQQELRAIHRAAVGAGGAEPHECADAALAVGHERLRHRAQRVRGELGGSGQGGHDRVAAVMDPA